MKTSTRALALFRRAAVFLGLTVAVFVFGLFAGSTRAATSSWVGVDLGTLGGSSSSAYAVNESGVVVGESSPGWGTHAFAWTAAGMVDLGTLGGSSSHARAVNDAGMVVGYSDTAPPYPTYSHAFAWTEADGMVDLGGLSYQGSRAYAVNNDGMVVGSSFAGMGTHAFAWTAAGMVDLGTLGGGFSWAYAVNEDGMVVGESYIVSGYTHAFAWTEATGMVDLGVLGGSYYATSHARAVNDAGMVVGESSTDSGTHAFAWTAAGMVDLGTLGGSSSYAHAVNETGMVVGESWTAGNEVHAFAWTEGDGMVDLGTLGGSSSSYATAVNESGMVVGYSYAGSGMHAFAWTAATGMVDLGSLGGPGCEVEAVNDAGQVVGSCYTADFDLHATLWQSGDSTPPEAPSVPDLAAASDSGSSDSDNITSQTSLAFTGSAEVGSTVTLYRDATVAGTATADAASGAWSIGDTVATDGSYSYTATATDAAGNSSPASDPLLVTVDTVAPTLEVPAGEAADATSPDGASVSFPASASDSVDPSPVLVCAPSSGTTFAIGDTTVSCSATDLAGNVGTASFVVHVRGAAEQLANLAAAVDGVGPGKSLADKVMEIQGSLAADETANACTMLDAFINEVEAQTGKKITSEQAASLTAQVDNIKATLGCQTDG